MISEIKAMNIKVDDTFTISDDLGKFKKGNKVTVSEISPSGDDIKLVLINEEGVKDTFYLDKNDNFEELV